MKLLLIGILLSCFGVHSQSPRDVAGFASLDAGEKRIDSEYSTIILRDEASVRSMYFVRDSGVMALESSLNMKEPSLLLVPYTRIMMGVFLFHSSPKTALMIGVGGGSMVHHIQRYHPYLAMDAVDIDPEVVRIAQEYFALVPDEKIQLKVADGFDVINTCNDEYDLLFMDAFLKPSEETDATGTPKRLKTMEFYTQIKQCLRKDGVVAFNINRSSTLQQDIKNIQESFGQSWVISVPDRGNVVVFAISKSTQLSRQDLIQRMESIEKQYPSSLSYEYILSVIAPE